MTRRLAGGIALVVASVALGFVLGWTEHRPAHHVTRLDEALVLCTHWQDTVKHPGWDSGTYVGRKAAVAACVLRVSR